MFGFFKRDPIEALERKRRQKYTEAMESRKYGDRALVADLYAEADELEKEIARLQTERDAAT